MQSMGVARSIEVRLLMSYRDLDVFLGVNPSTEIIDIKVFVANGYPRYLVIYRKD